MVKRSKWFHCHDCNRIVERTPQDLEDMEDIFKCEVCGIDMQSINKPREEFVNHTQYLHYYFLVYLQRQNILLKRILHHLDEPNPTRMKKLFEADIGGLIHLNGNFEEQLVGLDDIVTKLRRYPQIRDEVMQALGNEMPIREYIKEKYFDLDI